MNWGTGEIFENRGDRLCFFQAIFVSPVIGKQACKVVGYNERAWLVAEHGLVKRDRSVIFALLALTAHLELTEAHSPLAADQVLL